MHHQLAVPVPGDLAESLERALDGIEFGQCLQMAVGRRVQQALAQPGVDDQHRIPGFPGQGDALGQQRFGGVQFLDPPVQVAEQDQHLRAQRRRVAEGAVHPVRALVEQVARGERAVDGGIGVVGFEQLHHEVARGGRAPFLDAGDFGFAARLACLPQGRADATGDARHQQHGSRHAQPVATQELAQAVAGAGRLRQHRQAVEPAAQVVGQRVGGGVALLGFLGQGLEQHAIEVALERHVVAVVGVGGLAHQQRRPGGGLAVGGAGLRGAAGEQAVQQRAEAVDVHRRAGRGAAQLFGRGVAGRERAPQRVRALAGGVGELADAEIEQARVPGIVHQHVGWLDVAVDDEVAVRVRDRAADLQEQAHDCPCVRRVRIAPAIDAFALHQRHRQPAGAVVGHARVDQRGGVGMVEAGQDLGLALEALAPRGA